MGGLEFCNSKGALPRGERQASYLKSIAKEKVVDPILNITENEDGIGMWYREVYKMLQS